MHQKILVPLDGSKLSEAVLPHVQALARAEGAEVVVLCVATNTALEFVLNEPGMAETIVEDEQARARKYISEQAAKLRTAGFRCYHVLAEGAVAEAILRIADEIKADLIAMSTHGRTGAARWIMGSVADQVVRNSTVPVLLVRPETEKGSERQPT